MTKARLSVGTDTPTGEPAHGPAGPYVTDEHDDEVAAAVKRRPDSDPAAPRRRADADPADGRGETASRRTRYKTPVGERKRPASP
jgi:hypothetical protein